jgi:hypothetical protein
LTEDGGRRRTFWFERCGRGVDRLFYNTESCGPLRAPIGLSLQKTNSTLNAAQKSDRAIRTYLVVDYGYAQVVQRVRVHIRVEPMQFGQGTAESEQQRATLPRLYVNGLVIVELPI